MFNPTPIRPHKVLLFNEIGQTNFSTCPIRLHRVPFSTSPILLHYGSFTAGLSGRDGNKVHGTLNELLNNLMGKVQVGFLNVNEDPWTINIFLSTKIRPMSINLCGCLIIRLCSQLVKKSLVRLDESFLSYY